TCGRTSGVEKRGLVLNARPVDGTDAQCAASATRRRTSRQFQPWRIERWMGTHFRPSTFSVNRQRAGIVANGVSSVLPSRFRRKGRRDAKSQALPPLAGEGGG